MPTIMSLQILGGHGKDGALEPVARIELAMGEIVSVVGPTGCGKTTLVNDIELLANGETPTGRRVLIDGNLPRPEIREDPAAHPIALITQHTSFLSDLPVGRFLATHARIRTGSREGVDALVRLTLAFANELTGEPIVEGVRMTELSGGQTRALMLADATVICSTPVVLLDEVENAGIHRTRAVELLKRHHKIFVFVTHDPRIALLSDRRIIMREGCVTAVLETSEAERRLAERVTVIDDALSNIRSRLRRGEQLDERALEVLT